MRLVTRGPGLKTGHGPRATGHEQGDVMAADDFSRAFYPFLHEDEKQSGDLMEDLRFSLMEKARESVSTKMAFFEENRDEILAASLALARASVGRGKGEGISFNRRFDMKDGTVSWNPTKRHPDIVRPAGRSSPTSAWFTLTRRRMKRSLPM